MPSLSSSLAQPSRILIVAFALAALVAFYVATPAQAETYKILYTFQGSPDGSEPFSNLLGDGAGGFYGTTWVGGNTACSSDGCGTVYHLSPPAQPGGAWTETVLYTFLGGASDGSFPSGNLVKDASGNLFGSTEGGGPANTGTVFELSPPAQAGGAWTESILHTFAFGTPDGDQPVGGVVWGPNGALYGETTYGGYYGNQYCVSDGCGIIYQLTRPAQAGGAWTESVLYNFSSTGCCWTYPSLVSKGGSLYGTTFQLGNFSNGSVFQMIPPTVQGGQWTVETLYSFTDSSNGFWPASGVVFDTAGNLYGTLNNGGSVGGGDVFELQHPTQQGGSWTFDLLHNFTGAPTDGNNSQDPLVFDSTGNLYGVTHAGGYQSGRVCSTVGCGVVFKLSNSGGAWTETVIHEFKAGADGATPYGPVTVRNGIVYGTTFHGGTTNGTGIIFAITP